VSFNDGHASGLDWTMAKEYYEILADHKRKYFNFRVVKDVDGLLSTIESELTFVYSYIMDKPEKILKIEKFLLEAEKIFFNRVPKGSIGKNSANNNKSEALRLIDKAQRELNMLEAGSGMLQPKPTNLKQRLRKYGD